jgi:hypothetical protein
MCRSHHRSGSEPTEPALSTPRWQRQDITESSDAADIRQPAEANDATDPIDANDPTDPIDRTEPTDPMDSSDPREPIDSIEPSDRIDHRELDPVPGGTPPPRVAWPRSAMSAG